MGDKMRGIVIGSTSLIISMSSLQAQPVGDGRRAINMGTQGSSSIQAAPTTKEKVIVYDSGSNDGVYFIIPSVNIDMTPINSIFDSGECSPDDDSVHEINIILRPNADLDIDHVRSQIKNYVEHIGLVSHTIVKASLKTDIYERPHTVYSRDIDLTESSISEALSKIYPRPFNVNELIAFRFKGTCRYWNKFRNPDSFEFSNLDVKFAVPMNAYASASSTYSLASFMNSDEAQNIFSDQRATGKLSFVQNSRSKAGGILEGLLGSNKVRTNASGGIEDTRKRWITTDTLRNSAADYMTKVKVGINGDGLPFQMMAQDIVDQFISAAVEETKAVALTPDYADARTLAFADDDIFTSEQYATLAKAVADAQAIAKSQFSFKDCQEFIEGIVSLTGGGGAGAVSKKAGDSVKTSVEAQQKDKAPTKETNVSDASKQGKGETAHVSTSTDAEDAETDSATQPKNGEDVVETSNSPGVCEHQSTGKSKSGLTLKYDGKAQLWVPTSLDLHLVSREKFAETLVVEFKQLKLDPIKEDNWMSMPVSAQPNRAFESRLTQAEKDLELFTPALTSLSENHKNLEAKFSSQPVQYVACASKSCPCPEGYEKFSGDIRKGKGGPYVYQCVKR